jgi:hypothetical protein
MERQSPTLSLRAGTGQLSRGREAVYLNELARSVSPIERTSSKRWARR